jgi:DNA-binding CsgD family transcriptional regulator/tetratricopeptide (TPR) repeat protein
MRVEAMPAGVPMGVVPSVLVGRDTELALMQEAVGAVRSGVGGAVLVVGEAGSGKSSLMASVLRGVQRVVWVVGDELSQEFPLLPWVEAATAGGRSDIEQLLRGQLDGGGGVADSVVAASERLIAWVEDLAAASPVVVVFDDLHWADEASVRVWRRLTRVAGQAPVLVVGAMRPGSGRDELTVLRRHMSELQAGGRALVVELGPLSMAAVAELVVGLVGGPAGSRLLELASAAGGNPFYATELVGSLQRGNALAVRDGQVEAVRGYEAGSLVEAIADRFDLVPASVREVLQIAALLGTEFSVTDLGVASGRPVGDLAGMLQQAQAAGVVASRGAGMTFRHPLIRDVLCEQIAPAVRAAWHLELARVLADRRAPAVVVARQLAAAVECGSDLLAASAWLTIWLAAEGPTLAGQAVSVTITLYQAALGQVAAGDPWRPQLAVPLVSALYAAARYEEADRVAGQTLALGPGRLDADRAVELYLLMVDNLHLRGKHAELQALLDRAEAERAWDPAQRLRLQVCRLIAPPNTDDGTTAAVADRSRELLPVAERLDDAWATATLCHAILNFNFTEPGNDTSYDDLLGFFDRALAALEGHPELLSLKLRLLLSRAELLYGLYRPDTKPDVRRWEDYSEALVPIRTLAERAGSRRAAAQVARVNAMCMYQRGAWDDLPVEADTAWDLGWPSTGPSMYAAIAALHRDDEALAEPYLRRVADAASREGTANGAESNWAQVQSLQLRRAGRDAEALQLLVAGEYPAASWWHDRILTPRVQAARLAVSLGESQTLQQILRWNDQRADLHPGVRAQCRGLARSDPELLSQAVGSYQSAGQKLQWAEAVEDLGIVLAGHGDIAAARPHLVQAVRLYEELNAVWDLNRMRARFREYGIRTGSHAARRRPSAGWDSLTDTEVVVARLVADGKSNPEIAQTLYLSRRTVETHVSHILAKLDGRGRVDVARLAATQHSASRQPARQRAQAASQRRRPLSARRCSPRLTAPGSCDSTGRLA